MISIKRYLELTDAEPGESGERRPKELLSSTVAAYRSALQEMGNCGQNACPALGRELKQGLNKWGEKLGTAATIKAIEETDVGVREHLQDWGLSAAIHHKQQASEVKEVLLVMARTAESVGERDQRCASQFSEVTARLTGIANLEDLTEIRESIKSSAAILKTSIDRMTAEGKAAIEQLRAEVSIYQAKLEAAEEIASRDALTGLGSRLWVEGQIEQALPGAAVFCVAMIDINDFKRVNDEHGHLAGDELLKQFATELRSICRSTDTLGRWGGDEFLLMLNCGMTEAQVQMDRLRKWVCGNYTLQPNSTPIRLRVDASIGLAERMPGDSIKELVARADAAMYRDKVASRATMNR